MRLSMEADMKIEKREEHGNPAMPESSLIMKNVVGAVLILLIALALTIALLIPDSIELVNNAIRSEGLTEWFIATASGFVVGFLIGFPVVLLFQSLVDYRRACDLERIGLMTKGSVVDKWVEILNDKPVYRVRYKYLAQLGAVQTVDEKTFQQTEQGETIFILYLKYLPHISRLDLD